MGVGGGGGSMFKRVSARQYHTWLLTFTASYCRNAKAFSQFSLLIIVPSFRVSDPYSFYPDPDPDPAFEAGDQSGSGSRALMTKN
jgi:hypothetical protein